MLACALTALVLSAASALTEDQKIEKLIQTVGDMKDAVFIRNGTEHTPAQAAQHMRNKWERARDQVKTAEEFIDKLASKSSTSGLPHPLQGRPRTRVGHVPARAIEEAHVVSRLHLEQFSSDRSGVPAVTDEVPRVVCRDR
jgi:hypothetical protein